MRKQKNDMATTCKHQHNNPAHAYAQVHEVTNRNGNYKHASNKMSQCSYFKHSFTRLDERFYCKLRLVQRRSHQGLFKTDSANNKHHAHATSAANTSTHAHATSASDTPSNNLAPEPQGIPHGSNMGPWHKYLHDSITVPKSKMQ